MLVNFTVDRHLVGRNALALAGDLAELPLLRARRLTLSLRNVDRIDASGLVALVRLYSQLEAAGVVLALVDVSLEVAGELRRLGMASFLVVPDDDTPVQPPRQRPWLLRWLQPSRAVH